MSTPIKPEPRKIFTPSTLPEPSAPDPVVAFIEEAMLEIARRRDEDKAPEEPESVPAAAP